MDITATLMELVAQGIIESDNKEDKQKREDVEDFNEFSEIRY